MRVKRRLIYEIWENFIHKYSKIKPVFKKLNPEASPFVFPAYTESSLESKKYFDWGWKNGFEITSWPTLPEEIKQDKNIKSIWKKLICFPINENIDPNRLSYKLNLLAKYGNINEYKGL